eukprot:4835949-Pyramimonas_sp.AAC.1
MLATFHVATVTAVPHGCAARAARIAQGRALQGKAIWRADISVTGCCLWTLSSMLRRLGQN